MVRCCSITFLLVCLLGVPEAYSGNESHEHHHDHAVMADELVEQEAMEFPDHPLVHGRLSDAAAEQRMRSFIHEWSERSKARRSTVPVFAEYLEDLGTKRLVNWFQDREETCHGVLHDMGKVVSDLTRDLALSISICSDACTYACTHGALKRHYAAHGEGGERAIREARDELISLCQGQLLIEGFYRGNCAHAAGHAFGIIAKQAGAARKLCEAFPPEMSYYCETGVFMQLMHPLFKAFKKQGGNSRAERLANRFHYCKANAGYLSACLRFMLPPFKKPDDFAQLGKQCESLTDRAKLGCFNALGYLARVYINNNPAEVNVICGRGDTEAREMCISGFAFAKKGHAGAEKIDQACRALSDQSLSDLCLTQHARHYYQIGNKTIARMF